MPGEVKTAEEEDRASILAANRARGQIAVTLAKGEGGTRPQTIHEAGSLRVRFPRTHADALEAVIVNTGGGTAGGDCFDIDLHVGRAAQVTVTSASAEKVYRSLGPDARIRIALDVAEDGSLVWLPRETILFNGGQMARSINVHLADQARLVVAEAVIFGRVGMGEVVGRGRWVDSWRVHQDGRLIFAETVRLEGAIADKLRAPAVAGGGIALGMLLLAPGDAAIVRRVRALEADCCGEIGASAWNGLALVRFCAKDGAVLRRDLGTVLTALSPAPLPRLWLN
jgi:urease accessory protein